MTPHVNNGKHNSNRGPPEERELSGETRKRLYIIGLLQRAPDCFPALAAEVRGVIEKGCFPFL